MPDERKIFKTSEEIRMLSNLKELMVEEYKSRIQKVSEEIYQQKKAGHDGYFGWYCFRDAEVDAALERLFTESQRILDEIKEPLEGVGRSLEQCAALLESEEGGQEDE